MRSSNWNLFKVLLRANVTVFDVLSLFYCRHRAPSKTIVLSELKSTLRNSSHLSTSSRRSEDVKNA